MTEQNQVHPVFVAVQGPYMTVRIDQAIARELYGALVEYQEIMDRSPVEDDAELVQRVAVARHVARRMLDAARLASLLYRAATAPEEARDQHDRSRMN